jgi:hypothetical protein
MPEYINVCLFCGGDASEPDHLSHCDGRQGEVEERQFDPASAFHAREAFRVIKAPRETSIQAFYNAVDAGIIETRRAQVWFGLKQTGVSTSGEVFEYLKEHLHLGLRYDSNTCARFTELRDLGLIREVGRRACRVTGQVCITWEVVPSAEYAGVAQVHRCTQCGQIVSRDVPVPKASRR